MLSVERREKMRRIILEQKSVHVSEMAEHFDVSAETVRRDFEVLSKEGFVTKSYGGASLNTRVAVYTSLQSRREFYSDEKKRIAKKAAELIKPNDCIFLDHSSTVFALCDEIQRMPLVVVTNSLPVLNRLLPAERIQVISTGGTLLAAEQAFVGTPALDYIRTHCVDAAFLSCTKLSQAHGVADADERIAELRRAVVKNACKTRLLVDHTKIGGSAFVSAYDLGDVESVISDFVWTDEWKKMFELKNVRYHSC